MHLREAKVHELDAIYAIGFDAWSEGLSYEKYLSTCRDSKKYQAGRSARFLSAPFSRSVVA